MTPIVSILVFINVLIFLYLNGVSEDIATNIIDKYGFTPYWWHSPTSSIGGLLQTTITYMFLHQKWIHIINNMIFLSVLGSTIESILGKVKFLILYFGSGLLAILLYYYSSPMFTTSPLIGASGGIAGICIMYVFYLLRQLRRGYNIGLLNVLLILYIAWWSGSEIYFGWHNRINVTGVGHWAHVGGLIFGLMFGLYWFKFRKEVTNEVK